MKLKNLKLNKMTYTAGGIALALVIALGSTYAYRDFSQHKTNEFKGGNSADHDATLVENFVPVDNWEFDSTNAANNKVTKEVSVKNTGKKEVYVRVKFQEYMEISSQVITTTTERYIVKSDGDFASFTSQALAKAAYPGYVIDELTNAAENNPTAKWYVQSKKGDINGQYGRQMSVIPNGKPLTIDPVIAGTTNQSANGIAGEEKYPVHGFRPATSATLDVAPFIKLNLGNVKLLSTWDEVPGDFWIIDDTNDSGWMYWGNVLTSGQSTTFALENVELLQGIGGAFYYALHTNMDAVSYDESSLWNAGSKIEGMVNATK